MPAPVVVVHDEVEACEAILRTLSEAGLDAVGFTNPMSVLDAVEPDSRLRVLVTRMSFGPDRLNGLALFRMLSLKRTGNLRAVFIGRPEYREDAQDDGVFLLGPPDPQAVAQAVWAQLKPTGSAALRMAARPVIWEGGPLTVAPPSIPHFSHKTGRLLREARLAIGRTITNQQWRITLRRLSK